MQDARTTDRRVRINIFGHKCHMTGVVLLPFYMAYIRICLHSASQSLRPVTHGEIEQPNNHNRLKGTVTCKNEYYYIFLSPEKKKKTLTINWCIVTKGKQFFTIHVNSMYLNLKVSYKAMKTVLPSPPNSP